MPAPESPSPALEHLCARYPPPATPLQIGTWADVEALLGRPLPDGVRELADTYGAGSFAAPGGLFGDPPLHLRSAARAAHEAEEILDTVDLYDLDELLAGRPMADVRAASFAELGGGLGELWVWVIGADHGIAFLDTQGDWTPRPLAGSAADVVRDQLDARGVFEHWDHEPPPALFVPGEHPSNETLARDST
jgi:hypothetical protein